MTIPRAFASLLLVLLIVSPLCCMASNLIYSGDILQSGDSLEAGTYKLTMQTDCNLVLTKSAADSLATPRIRVSPSSLVYDTNGSSPSPSPSPSLSPSPSPNPGPPAEDTTVWASNTAGKDVNCYLYFSREGKVIVFGSQKGKLWEISYGLKKGHYVLILKETGGRVIYGRHHYQKPWL